MCFTLTSYSRAWGLELGWWSQGHSIGDNWFSPFQVGIFHWDIQVNREFLKGDAPMAEKHLKAAQLYSKLKLPQDFIFFQPEWPSSIKQTIKCWQGYRRRNHWFIPGGKANLYSHCGNQCGGSSESWNWCTTRWSYTTLEYIPKKLATQTLALPCPFLLYF